MSDETRFLHFAIGPVQSFVGQARRTRDFFAGSFLLSWLAAVAMREVQHHKGKILFPAPSEAFMAWLCRSGNEAPAGHPDAPDAGAVPPE